VNEYKLSTGFEPFEIHLPPSLIWPHSKSHFHTLFEDFDSQQLHHAFEFLNSMV